MAKDHSENLLKALSDLKTSLDQMSSESRKSDWIKTGQLELARIISCDLDLLTLSRNSIEYLSNYIGAHDGKIYQVNRQDETLDLLASIGVAKQQIKLGQDHIGKLALQGGAIVLYNEQQQFSIYVSLKCENEAIGVMEFVTEAAVDTQKMEFLRTASNHIAKAVKSCQEYTLMKSLLEKSQQLQDKVEQVSKNKTLFMAKVSHELRSPLTSLLILSQQLVDNDEGNLTYEQIEAASMINQAGKDLLDLTSDILDHSKVEVGTLKIHLSTVSIRLIVEKLQRQFMPIARDKELQFHVVVESDVPNTFTTDAKRVGQVLKNFLSNAFKFTSKGSVTLKVHRQDSCLCFSVSDTGLGITKEKQASIFEDFYQADDTIDNVYGGTGLGLSISSELAKMLQGEIKLESEPGKGSIFTLCIPYENIEHVKPHPVKEIAARPSNEPEKILIVDDDLTNIYAISSILKKKGMNVVLANNVKAALTRLENEPGIKLIIMNAFEEIKQLRQEKRYNDLPIIALSSNGTLEEKNRATEVGASDVLTRPVDLDLLLSSIKFWLSNSPADMRMELSRYEMGILQ